MTEATKRMPTKPTLTSSRKKTCPLKRKPKLTRVRDETTRNVGQAAKLLCDPEKEILRQKIFQEHFKSNLSKGAICAGDEHGEKKSENKIENRIVVYCVLYTELSVWREKKWKKSTHYYTLRPAVVSLSCTRGPASAKDRDNAENRDDSWHENNH